MSATAKSSCSRSFSRKAAKLHLGPTSNSADQNPACLKPGGLNGSLFCYRELLPEHYPGAKEEDLEHLDSAIKEFQDMKMQPSLERALRHKEILKA